MRKFFFPIAATIMLTTACAPIKSYHGFNNIDAMREWVKSNTVLQSELTSRFGPPSFVDRDTSKEAFYYVSFTKERFAFFKPEITQRNIIVANFDNGKFQNYAEYSLEDGNNIKILSDKTPAYGKELSVIQQILSNVGRFSSIPGQNSRNDGSVLGPVPGGI